MVGRKKHTEGFTLAEVLLAVAIILVLAAIAIPSIISVQNNMRMVELNNAAESIANAAQTQMTAKKAAGTWVALVKEDGSYKAAYPQANAANKNDDLRSMDAETARSNGVVSSLSIDEQVYQGAYVIEFDAATASVTRVFYTDGKSGFFGSASYQPGKLEGYYTAYGAQPDSQTRRRSNDQGIMVGYYEGTPASATTARALDNPVVWLNDKKVLCVQDKNLSGGESRSWATELTVTITKKGADTPTITIAGLSEGGSACTITAEGPGSNGAESQFEHAFSRAELAEAIAMTSKTPTSPSNVYAIDMNRLIALAAKDPAYAGLSTILSSFSATDEVQVDARIDIPKDKNLSYVPARAKAFMPWPGQQPKIYLYVTNPEPSEKVGHITGQFTEPETGLFDKEKGTTGEDLLGLWNETPDASVPVKGTSDKLISENPEAGRQKYAGGYVELSEAVDKKAELYAKAGSYQSPGSLVEHQYQIYEIWLSVSTEGAADGSAEANVDRQRVGYLDENEWTWENTDWGALFKQCVSLKSETSEPSAYTSLAVDCQQLSERWPVEEDSAGYEIYVRTTPKLNEVGNWFEKNIDSLSTSVRTETTGSRGENHGASIRKPFENEFGAPSTVALWEFTKSAGTMKLANGNAFPAINDIRVYYSATPAVAWGSGSYTDDSVTNALPSAALWLYEKDNGTYTRERTAMVQPAKEDEENYHLVKSDSADFEISYSRDELFYRVFEYFDKDDEKPLDGYDPVYVPYSSQDKEYAKFKSYQTSEVAFFRGWAVYQNHEPVLDASGKQLTVFAGETPAQYDGVLPNGVIQLSARYEEAIPDTIGGLVYIGLNEQGNKVAYGFRDGTSNEPREYAVSREKPDGWSLQVGSYYLAVDSRYKVEWCSVAYEKAAFTQNANLDGVWTYLYRVTAQPQNTQAVSFQVKKNFYDKTRYTRNYYINLDFARAVTVDKPTSDAWGTAGGDPWQIELPQQYPGALSSEKQKKYQNDHFLQTRDLDFSGANNAGFSQKLSGGYDGGGHSITGAENVMGSVACAGSSRAVGLFPQTEDAYLRNINLLFGSPGGVSPSLTYDDATNPVIYFGALTGYASGGSISGCSVSAADADSPLGVNLRSMKSGFADDTHYNAAGALAGRTAGTRVEGCSASNLSLLLQTDNKQWNSENSRNYFGGLIGVADISGFDAADKPLSSLAVNGTTLTVEKSTLGSGKNLSLGGLVGRIYAGSNPIAVDGSWGWRVDGVRLWADLGLSRADISSRLYVGCIIGNLAGTNANRTCTGVATSGTSFWCNNYDRNLSDYGPQKGPIPPTDDWTYKQAGLLYVSGADGDGWSAFGYAAADGSPQDETIAKTADGQTDLKAGCYYLSLPIDRGCTSSGSTQVEQLDGAYKVNGEDRSLYKLTPSSASSRQYEKVQLTVTDGMDKPNTHPYYVNFNFANALTADEAVAQSWGTDASPWQVALAKQFPGALPADVQAAYLDDCFAQIEDLDFSQMDDAYRGFAGKFSGVYDGQNHVVAQFQYAISTLSTDEGRYVRQGLFPWVEGGTLKNMQLAIENREGQSLDVDLAGPGGNKWNAGDGWTEAGGLAGLVSKRSSVENCSVTGVVPDRQGNTITALKFNNLRDLTMQAGIMVGHATDSALSGCFVSNVSLELSFGAGAAERSTRYLNMGGIVGSIESVTTGEGAMLARNSVTRIALTTNGKIENRWARAGGLAGLVGQATTLTDNAGDMTRAQTQAEDVTITFAAGQNKEKVKGTVGGLVGRLQASSDESRKIIVGIEGIAARFANVHWLIGANEQSDEAVKWYGNYEGNVDPKPDAAQLAAEAAAQEAAAREAAEREAAAQAAKEAERAKQEAEQQKSADPDAEETPGKDDASTDSTTPPAEPTPPKDDPEQPAQPDQNPGAVDEVA